MSNDLGPEYSLDRCVGIQTRIYHGMREMEIEVFFSSSPDEFVSKKVTTVCDCDIHHVEEMNDVSRRVFFLAMIAYPKYFIGDMNG